MVDKTFIDTVCIYSLHPLRAQPTVRLSLQLHRPRPHPLHLPRQVLLPALHHLLRSAACLPARLPALHQHILRTKDAIYFLYLRYICNFIISVLTMNYILMGSFSTFSITLFLDLNSMNEASMPNGGEKKGQNSLNKHDSICCLGNNFQISLTVGMP